MGSSYAMCLSCDKSIASCLGTSKSPFEMLHNIKVDVSYFKSFGSLCYVHIPKQNRTKLDLKSRKCVFVYWL